MGADPCLEISRKYCPRFGRIAVELGLINEEQLNDALACQEQEKMSGAGPRLLGAILLDKGWLSGPQVDKVMTDLFKRRRGEIN